MVDATQKNVRRDDSGDAEPARGWLDKIREDWDARAKENPRA